MSTVGFFSMCIEDYINILQLHVSSLLCVCVCFVVVEILVKPNSKKKKTKKSN